jgi:long-chain acyl-CoA synthetase
VPPGVAGEVIVRGPNVMVGYWEDAAATGRGVPRRLVPIGRRRLSRRRALPLLLDRAKDMIVTGGENVYSLEVEDALGSHPPCSRSPSSECPTSAGSRRCRGRRGARPALLTDTLEDELRDHCRRAIAGFKVPKAISIQADPLPKSGRARSSSASSAPPTGTSGG